MITLADMLTEKGIVFSAFDCDQENAGKASSFAHFLPGIGGPDIRSKADADKLLNCACEAEAPITLVDLPANSGGDFHSWFAQATRVLEFMPLTIICVGVITPEPASAASVYEWAQKLKSRVSYVIVLNRKKEERVITPLEETFPEYFGPTGQEFRRVFRPVEIEMPGLYDGSMVQWMKHPILPSQLQLNQRSNIPILDRARITYWAQVCRAEWSKASELLGVA